jgi:hypothetical protein
MCGQWDEGCAVVWRSYSEPLLPPGPPLHDQRGREVSLIFALVFHIIVTNINKVHIELL